MSQNLKGKREPAMRQSGKEHSRKGDLPVPKPRGGTGWTIWGTPGSRCGSSVVDEGGQLREGGRGMVTQAVRTRGETLEATGALSAGE